MFNVALLLIVLAASLACAYALHSIGRRDAPPRNRSVTDE
jgi:hypothetical protein